MKSAILLKYKGQLIPHEVLEKVLGIYKSCWSAAIVLDSKSSPTKKKLFYDALDSGADIKAVEALQEKHKDRGICLWFGQYNGQVSKEDLQPHPILWDKDNKPLICAFLAGDYSNMEKAGSSTDGATHAVLEELIPRYEQASQLAQGDLHKIMDQQRGTLFKKDMIRVGVKDTVITTVSGTGEFATFKPREDLTQKFPWGWHTNLEEAAAPAQKPETAEEPADDDGEEGFSLTGSAAETPEEEGIKPYVPEAERQAEGEMEIVGPAPSTLTNKQKRAWWETHAGFVPHAYKEASTQVKVPKSRPKSGGGAASKAASAAAAAAATKADSEVGPSSPIPLLSAKDKELFGLHFVSATDANSQKISNPAEIQAKEKEYPTFASQTGRGMEDVLMTFEEYLKLGEKVSVRALATLTKDLANIVRARQSVAPKAEEAEEEEEQGFTLHGSAAAG